MDIKAECSEYSYIRTDESLDVPYTTIPEIILRHSKRDPKSVAHVYINWETFEKEYLTFADIYRSATSFARGLKHLGIEKGDIVALGTDNTQEWMTVLVGAQLCGAAPLMFNFNLKDGSDLDSLLTKAGHRCKAIVFARGRNDKNVSIINNILKKGNGKGEILHPSLPNLKWSISMTKGQQDDHFSVDEICKMGDTEVTLPYIDPEDVAAIFLTSGSTGTPKAILHTHYSMLVTGFYWSTAYGNLNSSLFNDRPFSWIGG